MARLLSPRSRAREPQLMCPRAGTTEACERWSPLTATSGPVPQRLKLRALEAMLCDKSGHRTEKPVCRNERVGPPSTARESPRSFQHRPEHHRQIKLINFKKALETTKKTPSELKNTVPEMKNTLQGIKSRLDDTGEEISGKE